MVEDFHGFRCVGSVLLCFSLSVAYIGSLHVWNSPYSRDHPSTIKKRFISAFLMLFVSPCFLYIGLPKEVLQEVSLWELLGLRTEGIWAAIFLPLLLTMVLFIGPLSMEVTSGIKYNKGKGSWYSNLTNLIWLRNHVVAPLSEEFTYRSCMMPLLMQCFSAMTVILINPLFFGVAHFHHMWERIHHLGMNFKLALKISCFQFAFTTIFGVYSAYIFYRTNHFIAIFIVHAYCNHMGFPELYEVTTYSRNKKIVTVTLYLVGFVTWCFLLQPLTEPGWYRNDHTVLQVR